MDTGPLACCPSHASGVLRQSYSDCTNPLERTDHVGGWATWLEDDASHKLTTSQTVAIAMFSQRADQGPLEAQGAVHKLPAPRELFQAVYAHFLRLADVGLRITGVPDGHQGVTEASALNAFVAGDPEGDRELCVRAMAAVYDVHAAAVGVCYRKFRYICDSCMHIHVLHADVCPSRRLSGDCDDLLRRVQGFLGAHITCLQRSCTIRTSGCDTLK